MNSNPCGDIEYYPEAEDFNITDGEFNSVRGSVYLGPALTEAPQQTSYSPARVVYFRRAKGFTISGGNFMTIGGNLYDTRAPKVPPTSENPRDVHGTNARPDGAGSRHPRGKRQESPLHEQHTTPTHTGEPRRQNRADTNPFRRQADDIRHSNPGRSQRRQDTNPFISQMPQPIIFPIPEIETPDRPIYESPISENPWDGSNHTQSSPPFATYYK